MPVYDPDTRRRTPTADELREQTGFDPMDEANLDEEARISEAAQHIREAESSASTGQADAAASIGETGGFRGAASAAGAAAYGAAKEKFGEEVDAKKELLPAVRSRSPVSRSIPRRKKSSSALAPLSPV